MKDKYDTYTDLNISSYHGLRNIAEYFYLESKNFDESEVNNHGYFFYAASITFSTFMFEAWLNHAGHCIEFDWENPDDRTETVSKFEKIFDKLNLKYDKGREPYALIKKLFSREFRHSVVHGRTLRKSVNKRDVTNPKEDMNKILNDAYKKEPEIKWTMCIKKSFALKTYEELRKVIFKIFDEINEQNRECFKHPKASQLQHPDFPTIISGAIHKR